MNHLSLIRITNERHFTAYFTLSFVMGHHQLGFQMKFDSKRFFFATYSSSKFGICFFFNDDFEMQFITHFKSSSKFSFQISIQDEFLNKKNGII